VSPAARWGAQRRVPSASGLGASPELLGGRRAANPASLCPTVELNEVGFKFVRKCINAVETKGEGVCDGTGRGGGASCGLTAGRGDPAPAAVP